MPILTNDPLFTFEKWVKEMPRAELGGLLKEYVAESNHNGWDCWDRRNLTGIRLLFEDIKRYHEGSQPDPSFATKTTTTNPVP